MNKYLEDLKKELLKLNISKQEIEEIISDHVEMISEAQEEGLTDEELVTKFGNPADLAEELSKDSSKQPENTNEYKLFKTFPVVGEFEEVDVKLVSDDIHYEVGDNDSIEVYYKNIKDIDDYEIEFNKGKFVLRKVKKVKLFNFHTSSGTLLVKAPKAELKKFMLASVSGDVELSDINTKKLKIATTSGDLVIGHIIGSEVEITTVSGDSKVESLTSNEVYFNAVSGDFHVSNGTINGDVTANTVSGDFEINDFTAKEFDFKTVSGDLEASEFYPELVNLKSVSGDITINNTDKLRPVKVGKKKTLSGDINIK